ncbi:MAG: efflux RND transporter periplasmic adaptor subunit [Candidatus Saganbacteria bacterium]|nr:efflux RND transporter periplasmic adaptor subunit [Candidatus Saganbacteria bacterium]
MKIKMLKVKGKMFGAIYIFFVLLLSLTLVSCSGKKEEELKVVKVKHGNILAEIPATGMVEPRNRLEIKPPVAGRVEQVLVKEGQRVYKGQTLAWMSSSERATLLDAARSQGEEEYKHWLDVYRPAPVVAPLNGFIIKRDVEPGQSVLSGDPVLVMADRLIVKAQVDETDIGRIKKGQRVEIELDAYPGKKMKGTVEHIAYESTVINNVTIYEVDVLPKNIPDYFRAGMSATVNFVLSEKINVLVLPLKAVTKRKTSSYVFLKGQEEPKQIKPGLENTNQVEILKGLSDGDEVIIPTADMIKKHLSSSRRRGPINPFSK